VLLTSMHEFGEDAEDDFSSLMLKQAVSTFRFSPVNTRSFSTSLSRFKKMSDSMSLEYSLDRAAELKENLDGVLHDIEKAYQASSSRSKKVT